MINNVAIAVVRAEGNGVCVVTIKVIGKFDPLGDIHTTLHAILKKLHRMVRKRTIFE